MQHLHSLIVLALKFIHTGYCSSRQALDCQLRGTLRKTVPKHMKARRFFNLFFTFLLCLCFGTLLIFYIFILAFILNAFLLPVFYFSYRSQIKENITWTSIHRREAMTIIETGGEAYPKTYHLMDCINFTKHFFADSLQQSKCRVKRYGLFPL